MMKTFWMTVFSIVIAYMMYAIAVGTDWKPWTIAMAALVYPGMVLFAFVLFSGGQPQVIGKLYRFPPGVMEPLCALGGAYKRLMPFIYKNGAKLGDFRGTMKRQWIIVHACMTVFSIATMIGYIDWNWFLALCALVSFPGMAIFVIAFISGGNMEYLEYKLGWLPSKLLRQLGKLGEFYKLGSPSLYEDYEGGEA